MKFTGNIENNGNIVLEQISFELDQKTNRGAFALFEKEVGRLDINKDYTLTFDDGRRAEMLISSQEFKSMTKMEIIGFTINWIS